GGSPMNTAAPGNEGDGLRSVIQTLHPNIGEEIQGAINTLRKLQGIAGEALPGSAPESAGGGTATFDAPGQGGGAEPVARQAPVLTPASAFGRYQIVRQLGQGGMGAVYLAYDSELQRHVALKTPFLGGKPQSLSRFYREARAAAQIRS